MLTLTSAGPDATFALGRDLGARLTAGDVICLAGDLGAGKTLFVKGMAAGLGVTDEVTSPTFTIMQVYETGRLPVFHFDLYRLDKYEELDDIGFTEYVGADGVAIIEWADKFAGAMPAEHLWIEITRGAGESNRLIRLTPAGERYTNLSEEVGKDADTGA